MIAKARHVTRRWHQSYDHDWHDPLSVPDHTLADSRAVKYHNNLKLCSKAYHGCGNRRHGGYEQPLTRQELLCELNLREQLKEVGDE